jgi:hypothetical protein
LKKENGGASVVINAVPIDNTHIPTTANIGSVYPRLISIKDPINICALHNGGHLQFANNGLTVVYGNNGSGKSSYSRILKTYPIYVVSLPATFSRGHCSINFFSDIARSF